MRKYMLVDPRIRVKHDDLCPQPVVIRVRGTFNEEMAEKFSNDMSKAHESGQPVIPVVIDSYGGQVYSLLDMISQIQSARVPVATICEGKAMSCGAMLFIFGTEGYRYMAEAATLMIHDVASWNHGKVEEIKAEAKETERLQKLIFSMAAKHLGKKEDYFLQIIHDKGHAEWYLTPKEAKKHNITNHVGTPEFLTQVTLEYKFGTALQPPANAVK